MGDDSYYLTTHETGLAVIATAMKKARLRLDTLILNSFIGGILFTSGGMLYVMVQANCPQLMETNPGLVQLLQGFAYPIGLFYVVIMGVDLFNANILYFSAGLCRGAVSVLDCFISWFVSWWINLVGTIFVAYIICNFSDVTRHPLYVKGSVDILVSKMEYSFVETFLKSIAGNFFAALAIYLQLMAKPLHVKFLMMLLPVLSFVSMGFTHSVADMYMVVVGLINGAPVSVGTVAWKLLLPGVLGNIIGGSFFGITIWYLHIVVVERDQRKLNLPQYEIRDEQPELNIDSRVVANKRREIEEYEDLDNSLLEGKLLPHGSRTDDVNTLDRAPSRHSVVSRLSTRTLNVRTRSPKNVFPVYGMGPPLRRELSIASGVAQKGSYGSEMDEGVPETSANYIGDQIWLVLTNKRSNSASSRVQPIDFESHGLESRRQSSASIQRYRFGAPPTNRNQVFKSNPDPSGEPRATPSTTNNSIASPNYSEVDLTNIRHPMSTINTASETPSPAPQVSSDQSPANSSANIAIYRPDVPETRNKEDNN